jgi:hemerythrin-like domain-containing protein
MTPIETLRAEHLLILRALDVLEATARQIAEGRQIPTGQVAKLIEVFRGFADHLHHVAEEELLFPALERAGMPRPGPIAVMLHEHEQGRRRMSEIERTLPQLGPPFAVAAAGFLDLLRRHITKENEVLFPMAERLLAQRPALAEEVARGFAERDKRLEATGIKRRFVSWIEELEAQHEPDDRRDQRRAANAS